MSDWTAAPKTLQETCTEVVKKIAESLPCGECAGSGEYLINASCPSCHGTGHTDPATVATRLVRFVTFAREFLRLYDSDPANIDGSEWGRFREALSALAKPQEPAQ